MKSYSMEYSIESLKNMKNEINIYGEDILGIINKLLEEITKSDEIYDTPSGTLFREKMIEYLNEKIKYINENYLTYGPIIDSIVEVYEDELAKEKEMVGGN